MSEDDSRKRKSKSERVKSLRQRSTRGKPKALASDYTSGGYLSQDADSEANSDESRSPPRKKRGNLINIFVFIYEQF